MYVKGLYSWTQIFTGGKRFLLILGFILIKEVFANLKDLLISFLLKLHEHLFLRFSHTVNGPLSP